MTLIGLVVAAVSESYPTVPVWVLSYPALVPLAQFQKNR